MKILVIGGSYFLGRVFVMQAAKEHEVTVLNRGTYSMAELGAAQIKGDRRDEALWKSRREDFDVVVDFCAYEKGDIARVLRNMPGQIRQYIFVSTLDVYERGTGIMHGEDAPLETRQLPGEAGEYVAGKVALEWEIVEECAARETVYTVLRPAFIYGPFNYAPRESAYIQLMVQSRVLPHITDTTGSFQFVYVKDAAQAILKCLLNPVAYGQAYNLCQDQIVSYQSFYETLRQTADLEVQELPMSLQEAERAGVPLPFPVTEEESELSANERSKKELGVVYISFSEGMARTWNAFKRVYQPSL